MFKIYAYVQRHGHAWVVVYIARSLLAAFALSLDIVCGYKKVSMPGITCIAKGYIMIIHMIIVLCVQKDAQLRRLHG